MTKVNALTQFTALDFMVDRSPTAWAASTAYQSISPASVVAYAGAQYVCKTAHTSTSSFDATKWTAISLSVTQSIANALAAKYDVIYAYKSTFATKITGMRAVNPNLRIYFYLNATFLDAGTQANPPAGWGTLTEDWYSHNLAGNRLRTYGFDSWCMNVEPGSPWVANRVAEAIAGLASSHYDGVFMDTVGPAPVAGAYCYDATLGRGNNSKPYSIPLSHYYTATEWMGKTGAVMDAVAAGADCPVIGNGHQQGSQYFSVTAPTSVLNDHETGGLSEQFTRGENDTPTTWDTEADWLANVDMVIDLEAAGSKSTCETKVWVDATPTQLAQWNRYSLGTFLMGAETNCAYSFRPDRLPDTLTPLWADMDIGTPTGAYAKIDGVYQREFTKGKVLVNPSGSAVAAVALGGLYRETPTGAGVSSITVPAHDAVLLLGPTDTVPEFVGYQRFGLYMQANPWDFSGETPGYTSWADVDPADIAELSVEHGGGTDYTPANAARLTFKRKNGAGPGLGLRWPRGTKVAVWVIDYASDAWTNNQGVFYGRITDEKYEETTGWTEYVAYDMASTFLRSRSRLAADATTNPRGAVNALLTDLGLSTGVTTSTVMAATAGGTLSMPAQTAEDRNGDWAVKALAGTGQNLISRFMTSSTPSFNMGADRIFDSIYPYSGYGNFSMSATKVKIKDAGTRLQDYARKFTVTNTALGIERSVSLSRIPATLLDTAERTVDGWFKTNADADIARDRMALRQGTDPTCQTLWDVEYVVGQYLLDNGDDAVSLPKLQVGDTITFTDIPTATGRYADQYTIRTWHWFHLDDNAVQSDGYNFDVRRIRRTFTPGAGWKYKLGLHPRTPDNTDA